MPKSEYTKGQLIAELLEALQELIFASTGLVSEAYLRDAREVVAKVEGK